MGMKVEVPDLTLSSQEPKWAAKSRAFYKKMLQRTVGRQEKTQIFFPFLVDPQRKNFKNTPEQTLLSFRNRETERVPGAALGKISPNSLSLSHPPLISATEVVFSVKQELYAGGLYLLQPTEISMQP